MKCFYLYFNKFYILIILIGLIGRIKADDCVNSETPIICHGSRVIRSVVDNVLLNNENAKSDVPLKLFPGLEIVKTPGGTASLEENYSGSAVASDVSDARSNEITNDGVTASIGSTFEGFIGRASRYLSNHELKIKFSDLLNKSDFKDVVSGAVQNIDDGKEAFEGRKKDKGGGLGAMILMGLMMKKMMAALGFGAVGLLAAKALGVALMALMLAALIGVKKLAESGHDDGGHQVQYIMAHGSDHHRRKRDLNSEEIPLPYRGWSTYYQ